MSVLIKGLDMPDCCWNCPCLDGEYGECNISGQKIKGDGERIADCPLIELPDHGDLIDRDALMTRLGMAMDCEGCPNRTALYFCGLPREVMEVCDELENAPVVITAERGKDGQGGRR